MNKAKVFMGAERIKSYMYLGTGTLHPMLFKSKNGRKNDATTYNTGRQQQFGQI